MSNQMIACHLGYVDNGTKTGFRYSRGNPTVSSYNKLVPFNELSPIVISGFIKYLWIKKAQTGEHLRLMGMRFETQPLIVLPPYWYDKTIASLMGNQEKYSVYYHQYKQYIYFKG